MAKNLPKNNKITSLDLPKWMDVQNLRIVLFVFGFILYANTLTHDFTQDDAIVIYDNMYTTQGIKGIPGILEFDTFHGFFKEAGKTNLVAGGRYRPFSLVVFALLFEIFGNNPFGFHLFTVLLFSLTCVVLFNILHRLFSKKFTSQIGLLIAFLSSMLFAAHPIHTEAVANIKGVDEIFALLGSLLTLGFILKYQENNKILYLLSACFIFFLALLSKENTVTFLGIIPLTIFVFYDKSIGSSVSKILPLLVSTLLFFVLRTKAIGWGFGNAPLELMNNPYLKLSGSQYVPFTIGEKLATIFFTLGYYIKLLVLPHPLTHDYYPRHIEMMNFGDISVLLSVILYLFLLVYSLKTLHTRRLVPFTILFYLMSLSIVSNLFFPIGTNMSERFLFMPSVGFCMLLGYGLYWLGSNYFKNTSKSINYKFTLLLTATVCSLYGIKTFTRNAVWKDNYTLFTTDVKTSANSAKLQNSVGGELIAKAGKTEDKNEKTRLLNEAIEHLNKAISIHPNYHNAFLLLGNANFLLEKYDEAIKQYNHCLEVNPGYKDAIKNLHLAYREAGKYYGEKKGDLKTSLIYLNKAYEMNPDDYDTNRLLGVANGVGGQTQKALEYFNKAVKINPSEEAFKNLSLAYYNAGDKVNGDKYAAMAASNQKTK
ncbi:MAG: glycosyltransferase family 39 protein [Saprospiraceae bacterium]|nr:glycosyltransferase family 39 protein [Saprospiraceae bacterium]